MRSTTSGWRKLSALFPAAPASVGDVKGLSRQLLCPRCWVLCRLADSVSLRKCKVPISHCTGTQSQVQPYSLQDRCPKWDFQPMQLQVLTASLRPSASGHLWKSLQWLAETLLIFTYVGWGVQLFPFFFFLADYFHPINNNLECRCRHLHHQPHYSPRFTKVKP